MARINLGKVVPEKGIDYFTDAEVEEIKNEIKVEIDAQGMARDIELLKTDSGHSVELTLDPQTYQIVLVLKNKAGTALSTQTIDLPNENAITNIEYNDGKLVLTKQSGATSQINLTGLIEGLVTESDFNTFKEALQTTLEAINEKDAEQDEAIAENYKVINKLNEKLENQQKVIDQLPQVTGQGTKITLENTIEAQFTIFDVEGNSEQETTTGKNLANIHVITNLSNQFLSRQIVGDTIVLSNNTNSSGYLPTEKNLSEICPNLKVDDIVKLSFKTTSTTAQPTNAIYLNGINQLWRINEVKTITQEMLDSKVILYGGYNETAVISEFMIRLSSITDDTYEKYTNGASPNPNYEQPIESAGDNENLLDIQTIVKGRLDNGEIGYADNVENLILNKDSFSFTTNANYRGVTSDFIKISKDFIVSYDNLNTEFVAVGACYDKNKVWLGNTTITGADNQKYRQFAIVNNTAYVRVYFYLATAGTITVKKPKLEQGNKASGYSPYGMGSINEKIKNKNFATNITGSITRYGVTFTVNEDKSITANGTATSDVYYVLRNDLSFKAGETWSLSGCNGGSSTTYELYCYNIGDLYNGSITKTLTSDFVNRQLGIIVKSGTTLTNVTFYPQLELNSQATDYVPPQEQDYPIFVQQPMRSIDDVRDLFFKNVKESEYYNKDLEENKWYERHYIKYLELLISAMNNSENYPGWTNVQQIKNDFPNINTQLITKTSFLCNIFEKTSRIMVINTVGNNSILYLDKSLLNLTQTQWKENYPNLVLKLGYISPEPLDLPCTETQIQQLENKPSTYKDFTIIQSQDETPAYLEVSGIRDIDTMFDKVTNAIVSLGGNV